MIQVAGLLVHPDLVDHPLLGDAHIIEYDGEPITAMSAIDWERPTQIPTIAEPRRLPRGSGTLLLNEIAVRARRANVEALRYAGPYPTPALFASLLRSFRTSAREDEFCADVLDRALRVARDEIAIDFAPAPFRRTTTAHGFADHRDMLERVSIAGTLFDRVASPGSLARLAGTSAELAFCDVPWTRIAELDVRGEVIEGPHPVPALASDVVGKPFPAELREQFAELVADAVPSPLARDARAIVLARPITWADLGTRTAATTREGFAVHAGYWTHLAPRGLAEFALAVADALATVVTMTILSHAVDGQTSIR